MQQQHRSATATTIVIVLVGCIISVMLILTVLILADYKNPRRVRVAATNSSRLYTQPIMRSAPQQYRIRSINCNCVPFLWSKDLPLSRIMHGADIVMLQEVWRMPAIFRADVLDNVESAVMIAPVQAPVPIGKCTDSGLAAAVHMPTVPYVSCIAFQAFQSARGIDTLVNKGVAVFQCGPYLRIATLHCQATYQDAAAPPLADVRIRLAQFTHAVTVAVHFGCLVLMGDVNEYAHLAQLDAIVASFTHGHGKRIHTPGPTCARWSRHNRTWQHDAAALGVALDHAWLLNTHQATAHSSVVEYDTTTWTDHAGISFVLDVHTYSHCPLSPLILDPHPLSLSFPEKERID